jgi:ABC-type nitrate/sulfonate/bicarbonate transport system substrate-binding protein
MSQRTPRPFSRRAFVAVIAATLVTGLAACGGDDEPATNADGSLNTIDMTFTISSTSLAHQLVFAARDGGFFEKYKINANLVAADSSAVAMAALVSGSTQVAFVGRSEGVTTTATGQKIVYAYKHSTGFLSNVTVSKKFADAHPGFESLSVDDRLKALNGATIAQASANGVLTRVLNNAMASVGSKVKNTYVGTNTMPTTLSRGAVDGYMAPSPFQETSVHRGEGVTWIKGTDLPGSGGEDIVQGATVVTEKFLKSDRDKVVRVVAALQATAEAMKADQAKAKQLAQTRLKDTDPAIFDVMWQATYPDIIGPADHPVTVDDIKFMIDNDAAGSPEAKALDPVSLIVPQDVNDDANKLIAQVGS